MYFCDLHVFIILGVLQGPELILKRNQLITVVPYLGREYTITFELFINSYQYHNWSNILHFTRSGNLGNYGDRNPAVWIAKNKTMHVFSSIDGNPNYNKDQQNIFIPLKTWFPVKISQVFKDKKVRDDNNIVTNCQNPDSTINSKNNHPNIT